MEIRTTRKRILIVDGDPAVTRTMRESLESTGDYLVCTENEPLFSLLIARQFCPDFIFLGEAIPGARDCAGAERFKSDPHLKMIPMVVLKNAATNGEPASLTKPASLEALLHCIENPNPGNATA
jgi:CheY-like chemotaxis protein